MSLVVLLAAYALITAAALVPNRVPSLVRAALIVGAPFACWLVIAAVHSYEGKAKVATPPAGSIYLASTVDEPRYIYLAVLPPGSAAPRFFRVAYTPSLHRQVVAADHARRTGGASRVGKRPKGGRGSRGGDGSVVVRRYRLPPARSPEKN